MSVTSLSLLHRLQGGADTEAWKRLVSLYEPLIHNWLRRSQALPQDTDDLTQDVLMVVVREVPRFAHNGRPGAFRSWLRQITANRLRVFWRDGRGRPHATGGDFLALAEQLEDSDSPLSKAWDREHDEHVLSRLLELTAREFEPTTVEAFRRVALEGRPVEETATDLGISPAAIYIAKSRVLRRLRQEAEGLLD
ncbi:sigma-70 family RNA polymerase sigma factor [soil metagenome]